MKIEAVNATGRWLCLAGLLLMITGDSPGSIPVIRAPWLYLVLLGVGAACIVAGGGVKSWRLPHFRFLVKPLAALLAVFFLSTVTSQVHSLIAIAFEKTSGNRHTVATAWNAPIDAPVDQISMSGDLQSARGPLDLAGVCHRASPAGRARHPVEAR